MSFGSQERLCLTPPTQFQCFQQLARKKNIATTTTHKNNEYHVAFFFYGFNLLNLMPFV